MGKKTEVDYRNTPLRYIVYGAGLSATGSLAIAPLVKVRSAPDVVYRPVHIQKMNGKKIRKVAAGCGFSLFASKTELYGSGLNNFYQLGGPIRPPSGDGGQKFDRLGLNATNASEEWYIGGHRILLPEDAGTIVDIGAGRMHSVVGTASGALFCMGSNSHGQCGVDPGRPDLGPDMGQQVVAHNKKHVLRRIPVPGSSISSNSPSSPIKQVHCCLDTSFVLLENGEVYAWGLGTDGQLGNGNKSFQFQPTLVGGDLQGVKVACIGGTTDTVLAASTDGEVFVWGQNEYGQLGVAGGSDEPQLFFPRRVPFRLGRVTGVAATGSSCIVCNSEGAVYTWGSEVLGFGPLIKRLDRPMQLDTPLFQTASKDDGHVQRVYAGGCTMGAVTASGQLFTWGANQHGSLAIGTPEHQYFPYQVYIPHPIRCVSLGPDHSLFLTR